MIITLSGVPGSGKSTLAKMLQEKLGAERVYVGQMIRKLAKEHDMTLEASMEYIKDYPEMILKLTNTLAILQEI